MNISPLSSQSGSPAFELNKASELTPAERVRAAKLRGSALRNAEPAEQRAAVASQFEAVLVRQMLGSTITSMLGKNSGAAGNVYGDLLTDTFAQQLTAGQGMGLARVIEKQLAPRAPSLPRNP